MSGTAAGAVLAAAGLAGQLVATDRRLRAAALGAYAAGIVLLAADLLSSPLTTIRHDATRHPALATAAVIVGLAALAAGTLLTRRFPTLTLIAIVAAAPARVPVHAAGQQANLLLPLYALLLAVAAGHVYDVIAGREQVPRLGPIGWAAAALIAWSAISLLWTADLRQGGVEMLFFYLPFGYLLTRIAAARPTGRQLRLMLGTQVALALLFGAVAAWQLHTHHLYWNQGIIVGNQYAAFFRVNSLFYDASIYGRFMAVTIVLLAAAAVYRRMTPALLILIAVLFAAQYLSYSQSAMVALAAGAAVLGATVWPRRLVVLLAAAVVVVGAIGIAAWAHGRSARDVTSGRSVLLADGWRVVRHHPAAGAGLGGFATAARAGSAHPKRIKHAASHTTPVTVVAELGPIGLAAYAALLAAIAWLAFRAGPDRRLRFALAAGLATLLASSLFYNAYFEDPATWILTGLIAAVALLPDTRPREAPA